MNLIPIYPEISLLIAIVLIILIDMFLSNAQRVITHFLSLAILIICVALFFRDYMSDSIMYAFNNMFIIDSLSSLLKLFSCIVVFVVLIYSHQYNKKCNIVNSDYLGGEFYSLTLFSLLGQLLMISGNNVLCIYLGLELMSLSLYTLVALRRNHIASTEASIKYFILGALASGLLLYGISMLYGATGSLELNKIFRVIVTHTVDRHILLFSLVFIVAGLAFKLGAAPFHMWIPDVYQGAPISITLLLGSAPKLAIFAIMFRFLIVGLLPLADTWQNMLIILAILSIIIGNITAIAQTNIKRMLAYSTISHTGFMLLGMLSGVVDNNIFQAVNAYSASLFYIIIYVLTILGTFGALLLLSHVNVEIETLENFKGLSQRYPLYAAIIMIFMLSMAGIPPMAGFYAKMAVLQAAMGTGQIWLPTLAAIFSVVGTFYYLRIIKLMYFDKLLNINKNFVHIKSNIILNLNCLVIILISLFPNRLLEVSAQAIISALATFLHKVMMTYYY